MSKPTSKQTRPQAKAGTAIRLIKTLFSFYPRLLPAVVACLLIAAVSSSFGAVFLQGALQIVTEFGESGDWSVAGPQVFALVAELAAVYLVGVAASAFSRSCARRRSTACRTCPSATSTRTSAATS